MKIVFKNKGGRSLYIIRLIYISIVFIKDMPRSIDNHKPDCPCPPCRRRREGKLTSDCPKLGVQVSYEEAALVRADAAEKEVSVNAWLRALIQERFRDELIIGDGSTAPEPSG